MQKIKYSVIESLLNHVVGYLLTLVVMVLIFPFFDIEVTIEENIYINSIFTAVALIRTYVLRRIFTRLT
jgi:hypothetical protein